MMAGPTFLNPSGFLGVCDREHPEAPIARFPSSNDGRMAHDAVNSASPFDVQTEVTGKLTYSAIRMWGSLERRPRIARAAFTSLTGKPEYFARLRMRVSSSFDFRLSDGTRPEYISTRLGHDAD